jgi:hypothetical protein
MCYKYRTLLFGDSFVVYNRDIAIDGPENLHALQRCEGESYGLSD